MDFDKGSWMDDVATFLVTCRDVGVSAAVERSRSGNGAHVWFFFTGPVVAENLNDLLTSNKISERCRHWSKRLGRERMLERTCELIESLVQS